MCEETEKLILEIPSFDINADIFKLKLKNINEFIYHNKNDETVLLSAFIFNLIDNIKMNEEDKLMETLENKTFILPIIEKEKNKSKDQIKKEEKILHNVLKTIIGSSVELALVTEKREFDNVINMFSLVLTEEYKFLISSTTQCLTTFSQGISKESLKQADSIINQYKKLQVLEEYAFAYLSLVIDNKAASINLTVSRDIEQLRKEFEVIDEEDILNLLEIIKKRVTLKNQNSKIKILERLKNR